MPKTADETARGRGKERQQEQRKTARGAEGDRSGAEVGVGDGGVGGNGVVAGAWPRD